MNPPRFPARDGPVVIVEIGGRVPHAPRRPSWKRSGGLALVAEHDRVGRLDEAFERTGLGPHI